MSQVTENPKGGCVLAGINSVLGAIDRVCPIYHSGPGCCMQTTAADQGQSGHKSSRFVSSVSLPSTNMLEKEVVFGGTEKLRTTVQGAIDNIDADAYFVLTGCTAGIIGDDIVSVTEEFQDKGYSVYPIETPGFVGDSNLGYETVWTTMINQVIEEDVPKDDKLVNIFGIIPYHDPFWMIAVLGTRDQFAGGLYDRAARLKFERYDQIVLARRRLELVPCVLDRLDARRILEHAGQQLGVPAVAVGREIGVQLAVPVLGAFVAVIVVAGAQNVGNRVVEHAERARDGLPLFGRRLVAGPAVASRHGPEILLDHVARAEHQTDIQPLDVIPDPARHHFQQRLVVAVLDIGLRVR